MVSQKNHLFDMLLHFVPSRSLRMKTLCHYNVAVSRLQQTQGVDLKLL